MLDPATNEYLTSTDAGTPVGELFRRFWVPILLSDELPDPDGPPSRIKIMGEELVAFRDSLGRVGLVDAYCAHRGAPLFFGRNEECGLRCVYHGWKYDVSGSCIDMPNEPPSSRFREHIKLTAYPTQEAGGVVWAYMGPEDRRPELPGLEWLSLPPTHYFIRRYWVESNYLQSLEGDHDASHVSMLHSTLNNWVDDAWQVGEPQYSEYQVTDKHPSLEVHETDYGILTGSRRLASEDSYFWRVVPWLVPFYSLIASEPGTPLILNIRVPADDENCWMIRVGYSPTEPLARKDRELWEGLSTRFSPVVPGTVQAIENKQNDYLIDRSRQRYESFSGIRSVPAQDRAMQEGMAPMPGRPGTVDRSREHLCASDAAIVALRQRLLKFSQDLEGGTEPAALRRPSIYGVRAPAIELPRSVSLGDGAAPYLAAQSWERQTRVAEQSH
jgi:phthalate 4,5-dioxygenase